MCNDGNGAAILALLDEAKDAVQRAHDTGEGGVEVYTGLMLTAHEANAQILFETVASWELHVEVIVGLVAMTPDGAIKATGEGRLSYKDGTVAFGRQLDTKWEGVIKHLKPRFQIIATARHWYAKPIDIVAPKINSNVCTCM